MARITVDSFDLHCVVELFGHQQVAGRVREITVAGAPFIRVDIPKTAKRDCWVKIFSPSAIYAMTPVSEDIARIMAENFNVEPVSEWQLGQALKNMQFSPTPAQEEIQRLILSSGDRPKFWGPVTEPCDEDEEEPWPELDDEPEPAFDEEDMGLGPAFDAAELDEPKEGEDVQATTPDAEAETNSHADIG